MTTKRFLTSMWGGFLILFFNIVFVFLSSLIFKDAELGIIAVIIVINIIVTAIITPLVIYLTREPRGLLMGILMTVCTMVFSDLLSALLFIITVVTHSQILNGIASVFALSTHFYIEIPVGAVSGFIAGKLVSKIAVQPQSVPQK